MHFEHMGSKSEKSKRSRDMQLFGIRTRLIKPRDNLVDATLDALNEQRLSIEDSDLLVFASKAVATSQGRLRKLSSIKPSETARRLAREYELEPSFVEIVLQESKKIYGGVPKALITLKNNILTANAGVDRKNAPKGYVVLWPKSPHVIAGKIRREILEKTGKRVGVLIVDSRVTPLRMGTTGLALGIAGFEPVRDCRADKDLYGNSISITRHALADDLASSAHLVMGESDERTPVVLIRNAPVKHADKVNPSSVVIPTEQCLFAKHMAQKPIRETPCNRFIEDSQ